MLTFSAYLGLFISALGAATLLPLQSESVLVALLLSQAYSPWALLAVASVGNILGALINWLLGRYLEHFRHKTWFPVSAARLQQAQQLDEVQAMARARLASLDELYLQAQKDLAAQGSNPTPEAKRAVKAAQMAVAAQKQSIETNELNRQRTMLRFDDEGRLLEKLLVGGQP